MTAELKVPHPDGPAASPDAAIPSVPASSAASPGEPASAAQTLHPDSLSGVLPFDFGPLDLRPIESGQLDLGPLDLGPLDLGPLDPGLFDPGVAKDPAPAPQPATEPPPADNQVVGNQVSGLGAAAPEPPKPEPAELDSAGKVPAAPAVAAPRPSGRRAQTPFVLDVPPPASAPVQAPRKTEAKAEDKTAETAPDVESAPAAAPEAPGAPPLARTRTHPVVHADAVSRLSAEDALIHRVFAPVVTHAGAFGLTDDAAAIPVPPSCEVIATVDTLVAGVHFFPDDPPELIARKALRVNLSDLAAKAAVPLGFLLSIALPDGTRPDWLDAFGRGLAEDSKTYGIPLFGGDTVRTGGPLAVSITALGTAAPGTIVRRAGAQPGDWIMVSGTIGDAALGLMLRKHLGLKALNRLGARDKAHLADRYLLPQPRLKLAAALHSHATAAMDISDGLAGDLAKLCAISGVGARVETALLPLSPAAAAAIETDPRLLERVVTGGDDYEILATVPSDDLDAFVSAATRAGVAVTAIGEITAEPGLPVLYGPEGPMKLKQMSFSHF